MVASPPGKSRARAGRPGEKEDEAMGQIVALQVQGMDCGACERRLETVLGRLDGVGEAEADHVTGRVRLRFDQSRIGASALTTAAAERIEQAGFTVTGLPQREDEEAQ
jgi:copper chaperone CopZ